MNRIYPDKSGGILYEPADWRLVDRNYVQHVPTSCMFRIECNEDALRNNVATLRDFYAELAHVCEGLNRPDDEGLIFLGRGAIAVYLQAIGVWKPVVTECSIRECPVCKEPWRRGHRCDLMKVPEEDVPF